MLKLIFLFLLGLMIAGCFGAVKTGEIQTHIQAVSFLNPNIYNQPSPVVITFYQLKKPTKFQQAIFFNIYNDPVKTLGDELIDKQELEITPEQKQEIKQLLTADTHYIGIVAAFRNPDTSQWRELIAVTPNKKLDLIVNLHSQSINVKTK